MSTRLSGRELEGRTVYSSDGEKLGKVDYVLMDEAGAARYVQVKSGWFGMRRHTIPVTGFSTDAEGLLTPYTKAQFESAPTFADDDEVGDEDRRTIDRHYGVDVQGWSDEAMTRSEEELRIGTRASATPARRGSASTWRRAGVRDGHHPQGAGAPRA